MTEFISEELFEKSFMISQQYIMLHVALEIKGDDMENLLKNHFKKFYNKEQKSLSNYILQKIKCFKLFFLMF